MYPETDSSHKSKDYRNQGRIFLTYSYTKKPDLLNLKQGTEYQVNSGPFLVNRTAELAMHDETNAKLKHLVRSHKRCWLEVEI